MTIVVIHPNKKAALALISNSVRARAKWTLDQLPNYFHFRIYSVIASWFEGQLINMACGSWNVNGLYNFVFLCFIVSNGILIDYHFNLLSMAWLVSENLEMLNINTTQLFHTSSRVQTSAVFLLLDFINAYSVCENAALDCYSLMTSTKCIIDFFKLLSFYFITNNNITWNFE